MIAVRLGEIEGATLVRGDPELVVTSLVADSRLARPGSLFACLRGSRSDGHDFVSDAARRGAAAALCQPGRAAGCLPTLEAEEPLEVLGAIARLVRRRSHARVVGIGGSAGKTSTKDVLRALVARQLPTVASPASYNNELGVPLTLSQLEPATRVCVCELGTGGPGELAGLCRIAEPDIGVITAIGQEHLAALGTLEGVARAEAELITALPTDAPLVLPHDDRLLEPYRRSDLREWTFGLSAAADVHVLRWLPKERLTDVVISVRGERVALRTSLRLAHHRLTLAAAVGAYAALGLPLDGVAEGAREIRLSPLRGEEHRRRGGGLLVNDAYNANPLSVRVALESLVARRNGARAVAVLGEMADLGATSARWHAEIGAAAVELGVDLLVAVGPRTRPLLEGAVGRIACSWLPSVAEACRALPELLQPGDVVLLKGSRSARLERLAGAILR